MESYSFPLACSPSSTAAKNSATFRCRHRVCRRGEARGASPGRSKPRPPAGRDKRSRTARCQKQRSRRVCVRFPGPCFRAEDFDGQSRSDSGIASVERPAAGTLVATDKGNVRCPNLSTEQPHKTVGPKNPAELSLPHEDVQKCRRHRGAAGLDRLRGSRAEQ